MLSKIGSNINSAVDKIFNASKQLNDEKNQIVKNISSKALNTFGTEKKSAAGMFNPFLNAIGEVANPQIPFQHLLDSPSVSTTVKDYITLATGLQPSKPTLTVQGTYNNSTPNKDTTVENTSYASDEDVIKTQQNVDVNNLAKLDVVNELPKLTVKQIEAIIGKYFSKSPVLSVSDAQGIYEAQMKSGMSALAVLGIGALESAYGTSNIAKKKGNLWGWNATNVNPMGNAHNFSSGGQGAYEFSDSYLKTYYNKYGAKSIYSAGTGDNPAGKGYAYWDNGTINSQWATSVGQIMSNFYNTALSVK
jgi:hypothetical protein